MSKLDYLKKFGYQFIFTVLNVYYKMKLPILYNKNIEFEFFIFGTPRPL